jgi:transcriptional regulator with XRE-family HTH domain
MSMSNNIDFSIATSEQIETTICTQLENIRLVRNLTQVQLAEVSGLGVRTIKRLEKGQGVSFDTFIRIMIALGLQDNLKTLLPDPRIRPIDRVNMDGSERKRARPIQSENDNSTWAWGDETDNKK